MSQDEPYATARRHCEEHSASICACRLPFRMLFVSYTYMSTMYRCVRLGQSGLYRGHPKRDQNSCDFYKPLFMKRLKSHSSIQPMAVGDQIDDEKFHVAGLSIENRKIRVPLDYDGVLNGEIDIFYRIVTNRTKTCQALPFLVYIQGKLMLLHDDPS